MKVTRNQGVESVSAAAYTIPTDAPESDGTLEWDSTTIVIVLVEAHGSQGLGYSYAHSSAATLIEDKLASLVTGRDPMDTRGAWQAMVQAVRNLGRPGVASTAISAVDVALWDLKAKLLGLPLATLLGASRNEVPAYGSGGFTSYSNDRLAAQLSGWVRDGLPAVKMKVGRVPAADVERVRVARKAIGNAAELFVDANGAYSRKQALGFADAFANYDVRWFEEPVTSDDLDGLRLVRDRAPAPMDVSAGEYGYTPTYFLRMLNAGAVDVLQADATRCGGVTGFTQVGALCQAATLPLSAHTAPAIHVHLGCAMPEVRHVEYFHDHVRIEDILFDGGSHIVGGQLQPDFSRPGLGLALKSADADRYAI